jgi:hypothetical protein
MTQEQSEMQKEENNVQVQLGTHKIKYARLYDETLSQHT